jgi:hypothetical protein
MTSSDLSGLTNSASNLHANILDPNFLSNLIVTNLIGLIARVLSGLVISLIIFPVLFLALLGIFTRSIASLFGGSSSLISFGGI